MKVSRRDFLKGSSAAMLSLAATSLVGCSSTADCPTPEVIENNKGCNGIQELEMIPAAYINPQDESYRSNTKELKTLFSPITIGCVTSSHRMIKSAAGSATYLAGYTDELFNYYVNMAKGGVEFIYVEGEAFVLDPTTGRYSDEAMAFGKKLVNECAKYNTKLGYQWAQFGMGENEMTVDQIHAIQASGLAIAKCLKEMGFVALEINAAGFNMGEHFLSRFHNTRTDEYGYATIANRARFVTEIIEMIKKEVKDFNVQILIDCIEENDNIANNPTLFTLDSDVTNPKMKCTTLAEGIALAKKFEEAGADSMHLRLGPQGHHVAQFGSDLYWLLNGVEGVSGFGTQFDFKKHWEGLLIGNTSGCGNLLNVAAKYKEALTIPCGAVTYMDPAHAPDFFETALEEGKVDFFMMTRPLTVDFEYVNKLRAGKFDEIAPCTRCLHCHIGSNEANAAFGYCRVNALTQRVMRSNGPATYELPPIEKVKNVMVVGAGPAGMEAARIAAERGHNVTLYEKRAAVGGLLDFAEAVKGKHENLSDLKNYLKHQCELRGVNIVTGTEVTVDLINKEAPDAVVVATGGLRAPLTIETDGSSPIIDIEQAMFTEMGENVVVYGSNAQAFDMALWLVVHKKHVTMVTPSNLNELDMQQSQHQKRMMTTALYSLGFNSFPTASIKSVKNNVLTFHSNDNDVDYEIACDAIVNCADMLPNNTLEGISGIETYTIGDAKEPFNIALAIRSGNDIGRSL